MSISQESGALALWAKSNPRHPLWKHLLDSAAVSLALPSPAIDNGWQPLAIAFVVGLHDIGKADATFQYQVVEFSREAVSDEDDYRELDPRGFPLV